MRVRHRAFALIIVLLAVAMVFALGLQSATASRAALLESRMITERVRGERTARAAAALVLRGLTTPPDGTRREAEIGLGPGGTATPDGLGLASSATQDEKPQTPDLPEILKEILGVKSDDIKKGADAATRAALAGIDGGGLTGRTPPAGLDMLKRFGLPAKPVELTVDATRYRVTLSDAMGGLNINRADEDRLVRYLKLKSIDDRTARALAQQIIDWRDPDDFKHELGAESAEYRRRGVVPRNADFFALEELLYLPDMTREIFDRIKGDLCVTGDARAHLASASPEVLRSIEGMTGDSVSQLVRLRESGGLTRETAAASLRAAWDRAKADVRFEPSPVVRFSVQPLYRELEKGERQPVPDARRFEGLAVIGDDGLKELGIRAP